MQRIVPVLSYLRVEDNQDYVSLAHEDLVNSTPASQLPEVSSRDQAAFEVLVLGGEDVSQAKEETEVS